MAYRHILLALDYDEAMPHVIEKALGFVRQSRARFSVVHVLDNIAMPDTGYGTAIALRDETSYPELEAEKHKYNQVANRLNVEPANRWLIWGNPKQEIVELAVKEQVDLIVMGSHGRYGLSRLLGSTADAVFHHSQCDVLAIRLSDD